MSDMLPCPFCGGNADIMEQSGTNTFGDLTATLSVQCKECGAEPYKTVICVRGHADWKKERMRAIFELIEKWQRRTKVKNESN